MQKLINTLLPFLVISLLYISCGNDVRPPEIILYGKILDTIELNSIYTEPGFIAKDKKDGDLTSKVIVSGTINTNKIGDYQLKYEVFDKSGNQAKAYRNIHVFNKANYLEGVYTVNETVIGANPGQFNYQVTAKSSETKNLQLDLNNFGGYGIYVNVKADIIGNTIIIPVQTPSGMPLGSEGTISGNGEIENNKITKINFICNYSNGGTDTATCIYNKQ
jgi:hypothetical protein